MFTSIPNAAPASPGAFCGICAAAKLGIMPSSRAIDLSDGWAAWAVVNAWNEFNDEQEGN